MVILLIDLLTGSFSDDLKGNSASFVIYNC